MCIVGASGSLGLRGPTPSLDRGDEVVGVCREQSVAARRLQGAHHYRPGGDRRPRGHQARGRGMRRGAGRAGPQGVHGYSTGTAQAVLDYALPGARLVFSCGWHITRDGQDVYSLRLKAIVKVFGPLARSLASPISTTRWRRPGGSSPATRGGRRTRQRPEEGESQGLPVWSRHVGDPVLESNITRRVDFALFMVEALDNDELVHKAPAIVGRQTPSALAYAA